MNSLPLSPLSQLAARATVLIVLGTAVFLILHYPALPDILPVHFNRAGVADGWQYRTVGRVLMPMFVQVALALSLGAIAALLPSRSTADRNAGPVPGAGARWRAATNAATTMGSTHSSAIEIQVRGRRTSLTSSTPIIRRPTVSQAAPLLNCCEGSRVPTDIDSV